MYLDAVKQATMNKNLDEKGTFDPTRCEINEDGTLICDGVVLELEVSGKLPTGGIIKLNNHNITNVKLNYGEETIIKSKSGELINFENEYKIGQQIRYRYNSHRPDETNSGYVIDEGEDWVTVITRYSYDNIYWSSGNAEIGPTALFSRLNSETANWDLVDPIENYTYNNNKDGIKNFDYQKIEIRNGTTKIISEDGNTKTVIPGTTKARIITLEEVFEISMAKNPNLTQKNLRAYIERNLDAIKSHIIYLQ